MGWLDIFRKKRADDLDRKITEFVSDKVDAMESYRCTVCGEQHVVMAASYGWPDVALVTGDASGSDAGVERLEIAGKTFIRGVLAAPVVGGGQIFGLGMWLRLDTETEGWIANNQCLDGPLLGRRARVVENDFSSRPDFQLVGGDGHCFAEMQRSGVPREKANQWRSEEAHRGEPIPRGAQFAGTIDAHDWELVAAEAMGKRACREELEPGDLAKLAIRVLTVAADGTMRSMVAGWWMEVDYVESAWISGVLHSEPSIPTAFDRGARFVGAAGGHPGAPARVGW